MVCQESLLIGSTMGLGYWREFVSGMQGLRHLGKLRRKCGMEACGAAGLLGLQALFTLPEYVSERSESVKESRRVEKSF